MNEMVERVARAIYDAENGIDGDQIGEIAVGFLLLGAVAATVFLTFKSTEYADNRWPAAWWLPLLGGLAISAWIADHALGYLAGL